MITYICIIIVKFSVLLSDNVTWHKYYSLIFLGAGTKLMGQ